MTGLTVALVAEEGKKIFVRRTGILCCRLYVQRGRGGLGSRLACAVSGSEGRPGRCAVCGAAALSLHDEWEVAQCGNASAETQARGLTLHPDVREGSLDRLVRCVSLCGELCVQKREIFYLIPL